MYEISHSAPYKFFGSFRFSADDDRDMPLLDDWIDKAWDQNERNKVLEYLKKATCLIAAACMSDCPKCGESLGIATFSDGLWVWDSDFIHYIQVHSLKLPSELIVRIQQREYLPPELNELEQDKIMATMSGITVEEYRNWRHSM